jgi:hypothetical protein
MKMLKWSEEEEDEEEGDLAFLVKMGVPLFWPKG